MPNGNGIIEHYDFEDISQVPDSQLDIDTGELFIPAGRVTPGQIDVERVSIARLLSFVQGTLGTEPTALFRTGTTAPNDADKRDGVAQLYLYQASRTHGPDDALRTSYLYQLYYHAGVLAEDWQRITSPPQVYFVYSRPDSEEVYWSYLEHGSANIFWIVFNNHHAGAAHPINRGIAYYQNFGQVRDVHGALIQNGDTSETTQLRRGTLARVMRNMTYTDGNGAQHTVETSPELTVWRLYGTLMSEQNSPRWEFSSDGGTTWHHPYQTGDTLGRQDLGILGGNNADPTQDDARYTPPFVIHHPQPPAETTDYGIADASNMPVGTANSGTLGTVWNFPTTTPAAPKHYFNVPAGKTVAHILNVALSGAQETIDDWQQVTINNITRYVRQPLLGRTGQYRVVFE